MEQGILGGRRRRYEVGQCLGMTGGTIKLPRPSKESLPPGTKDLSSWIRIVAPAGKIVGRNLRLNHDGWLNCWVNNNCKRGKKNPKGFWEGIKLLRRSLWSFLSPLWERKRGGNILDLGQHFGLTVWMWTEIKKSPQIKIQTWILVLKTVLLISKCRLLS